MQFKEYLSYDERYVYEVMKSNAKAGAYAASAVLMSQLDGDLPKALALLWGGFSANRLGIAGMAELNNDGASKGSAAGHLSVGGICLTHGYTLLSSPSSLSDVVIGSAEVGVGALEVTKGAAQSLKLMLDCLGAGVGRERS